MLARLLAAYRRTGADPPFGDPWAAHGVLMEGYFWRFTDAARGRVVIALCGVSRAPGGSWATVALAAHPGGFVRWATPQAAQAGPHGLSAGAVLTATRESLELDLGEGARLSARLHPTAPWPYRSLGALGPGHLLPGMPQYWHPHLLSAAVEGEAEIAAERWDLGATTGYAEKNWGGDFPGRWWWGQAHGFPEGEVTVAFAGGRVAGLRPTAAVVALGSRVQRFPLVHAAARGWPLRAPGLVIEADVGGLEPHVLPVPVSRERRAEARSHQWLAGRLRVELRRRGRLLYAGESQLAGLESGLPSPARPARPRPPEPPRR